MKVSVMQYYSGMLIKNDFSGLQGNCIQQFITVFGTLVGLLPYWGWYILVVGNTSTLTGTSLMYTSHTGSAPVPKSNVFTSAHYDSNGVILGI